MNSPHNWLFILAFVTCAGAWAQNDREFSGTWLLNAAKSDIKPMPEAPDKILRIRQNGTAIHCVALDNASAPAREWDYSTDGRSIKNTAAGRTTNSATKWEGAALLTNTIVDVPGESYTIMDRWKLSRDGGQLTIERQVVRRQGEMESTLIYEKDGAPKPPALITSTQPATVPETAAGAPAPGVTPSQPPPSQVPEDYVVATGTRVPLSLLTPVSTKKSNVGDRVYLDTLQPVLVRGRVVIPAGSHVIGQLREVQAAGRVKGKSEMMIIFDTISLPNGVTRDFHSRVSGTDALSQGQFDREEGKIQGNGRRATDARRTAEAGAAGASVGTIAGAAAGHLGMGAGIGAAAGALAGLAGSLASHGPDVTLPRGTTIEMVLDRELRFTPGELGFR